jgi:hypothetical protein
MTGAKTAIWTSAKLEQANGVDDTENRNEQNCGKSLGSARVRERLVREVFEPYYAQSEN